jgi:hypothetical protein
VIGSNACAEYLHSNNESLSESLIHSYQKEVHKIERVTGKSFGASGSADALLLAVRVSPPVPMPGYVFYNRAILFDNFDIVYKEYLNPS